jgi:hypothetical protein
VHGSVRLSAGPFVVGRKVTARVTIANDGGTPVALEGIHLVARGPSGADVDMGSDQAVTLAPGQRLAVAAVWPLDTVGSWSGWVEVVQGGQARLVGEKSAFTFRVTLAKAALVRRWIRADQTLPQGVSAD